MNDSEVRGGSAGWMILAALGAINLGQGLVLFVFGGEAEQNTIQSVTGVAWADLLTSNPSYAHYIDNLLWVIGLFVSAFGLLVLLVSITGYRRREPWSWYVMWAAPGFYSVTALLLFVEGEIFFTDDLSTELFALFLLASVLVLALDRKRFRQRHSGLSASEELQGGLAVPSFEGTGLDDGRRIRSG